ncbi:MAG: hypothetical protein ABR507_06285, partial [Actinomycetota bacterium]
MSTAENADISRLKVMFDHRMTQGGAGRYARELIAAIKQQTPRPRVQVFGPALDKRGKRLTAAFTPSGRLMLGRAASHWGADIVHGLHFEIPAKGGSKKVVTIQDLIPLDFPASMPNRLRRSAFRRIIDSSIEAADAIIVPSDVTG